MNHIDLSSLLLGIGIGVVTGFILSLIAGGGDSGVPRPRGKTQDQ